MVVQQQGMPSPHLRTLQIGPPGPVQGNHRRLRKHQRFRTGQQGHALLLVSRGAALRQQALILRAGPARVVVPGGGAPQIQKTGRVQIIPGPGGGTEIILHGILRELVGRPFTGTDIHVNAQVPLPHALDGFRHRLLHLPGRGHQLQPRKPLSAGETRLRQQGARLLRIELHPVRRLVACAVRRKAEARLAAPAHHVTHQGLPVHGQGKGTPDAGVIQRRARRI